MVNAIRALENATYLKCRDLKYKLMANAISIMANTKCLKCAFFNFKPKNSEVQCSLGHDTAS